MCHILQLLPSAHLSQEFYVIDFIDASSLLFSLLSHRSTTALSGAVYGRDAGQVTLLTQRSASRSTYATGWHRRLVLERLDPPGAQLSSGQTCRLAAGGSASASAASVWRALESPSPSLSSFLSAGPRSTGSGNQHGQLSLLANGWKAIDLKMRLHPTHTAQAKKLAASNAEC